MPKHMTIINLACTITKLRKWGQAWKYSAESAQNAASQLTAEHERKLTEHRAAFGVRTEADAKIIAGLREELDRVRNSLGIQAAKEANKVLGMVEGEGLRGAAERVVKERDTLRAEVAELKTQLERLTSWAAKNQAARETLQTEMERLRSENQIMRNDAEDGYAEAIKVLGDPIALSKERDALRAEVAALKSQTPKHPVKVGEWVRRTTAGSVAPIGKVGLVLVVWSDAYEVQLRNGFSTLWSFDDCTPCDPPTEATHDTPAGKAAAESVVEVVRTEPDEIKVGDVVEVFRDSSGNTLKTDVGIIGKVLKLYSDSIDGERLVMLDPESQNRQSEGGCHYALCDVRKVTT